MKTNNKKRLKFIKPYEVFKVIKTDLGDLAFPVYTRDEMLRKHYPEYVLIGKIKFCEIDQTSVTFCFKEGE